MQATSPSPAQTDEPFDANLEYLSYSSARNSLLAAYFPEMLAAERQARRVIEQVQS